MLAAGQLVHAVAARLPGPAYTSRAWPIAEAELPAWRVYAAGESINRAELDPDPVEEHELDIELQGLVSATDALDDAINAHAAQGLVALFDATPPPDALAAFAGRVEFAATSIDRRQPRDGQAKVGQVIVTVTATFRVRASDPETIIL